MFPFVLERPLQRKSKAGISVPADWTVPVQAVVDATSLVLKPGISRGPGLCSTSALSDCSCWRASHGKEVQLVLEHVLERIHKLWDMDVARAENLIAGCPDGHTCMASLICPLCGLGEFEMPVNSPRTNAKAGTCPFVTSTQDSASACMWGLQHGVASMQEALCGLSWRPRSSSTIRIYKRTRAAEGVCAGICRLCWPIHPEASVIRTRASGDATSFSSVSGPRTSSAKRLELLLAGAWPAPTVNGSSPYCRSPAFRIAQCFVSS